MKIGRVVKKTMVFGAGFIGIIALLLLILHWWVFRCKTLGNFDCNNGYVVRIIGCLNYAVLAEHFSYEVYHNGDKIVGPTGLGMGDPRDFRRGEYKALVSNNGKICGITKKHAPYDFLVILDFRALQSRPPGRHNEAWWVLYEKLAHDHPEISLSAMLQDHTYLQKITSLDFGNAKIKGEQLSHLKDYSNLTDLDLGYTTFDDRDLWHIRHLTQLKSLDLTGTNITDKGLEYLSNMDHLEKLYLEETRITEDGLEYLTPLKNVRFLLTPEGMKVTDKGFYYLGQLDSLVVLKLNQVEISDDSCLNNLLYLKELSSLKLSGQTVTDEALKIISQVFRLRYLSLDGCNVGDEGLVHLRQSLSLRTLVLDNTGITDAGLSELTNCPFLVRLHIRNTNVSAQAVQEFQNNMPQLKIHQ